METLEEGVKYVQSFCSVSVVDFEQIDVGWAFISFYRYTSQTADNYDSFLGDNFQLNLDPMTDNSPFLVVAIGDFNARSSSW